MMTETVDPIAKARAAAVQTLLDRADSDAPFRALLLSDPRAAVVQVFGTDPLPGVTYRVVEEQAGEVAIVLPRRLDEGELPDTLLDLASGGTLFCAFLEYGPARPPKKR
ncbi:NHLP leader peptide family natural product precursor [Novispirillum itersonii]|uniref:NHLP leader peptide family natural product n=2 Tax=Novispirillum itersonii TaxID=189 RepID=A0A7X0DMB8_NOVIT|nr:hypothetical protein [Novispirillum itersonii]